MAELTESELLDILRDFETAAIHTYHAYREQPERCTPDALERAALDELDHYLRETDVSPALAQHRERVVRTFVHSFEAMVLGEQAMPCEGRRP